AASPALWVDDVAERGMPATRRTPIVGPGQSVTGLVLALRIAIPGGAGPEANATIGASIRHRVRTGCATPVGADGRTVEVPLSLNASAEGRASATGHAG